MGGLRRDVSRQESMSENNLFLSDSEFPESLVVGVVT